MNRNCTFGVRIEDEFNVILRLFRLHEAYRLFSDVD